MWFWHFLSVNTETNRRRFEMLKSNDHDEITKASAPDLRWEFLLRFRFINLSVSSFFHVFRWFFACISTFFRCGEKTNQPHHIAPHRTAPHAHQHTHQIPIQKHFEKQISNEKFYLSTLLGRDNGFCCTWCVCLPTVIDWSAFFVGSFNGWCVWQMLFCGVFVICVLVVFPPHSLTHSLSISFFFSLTNFSLCFFHHHHHHHFHCTPWAQTVRK